MHGRLELIHNRNCLIGIVSENHDEIRTITDCLRQLDYKHFKNFSNLDNFLAESNWTDYKWVISDSSPSSKVDIVKFLKIIVQQKLSLRLSLLTELKKIKFVSKCYHLGILNHINSNGDIPRQISIFLEKCNQYANNTYREAGLAAFYYRKILEKNEAWAELIDLECKMSNMFPQQISTLILLAEAYLKSNNYSQARIILDQIRQIGNLKFVKIVEQVIEKYPQATIINPIFIEKYNISKISVIEADDSEFYRIENCLLSLSVPEINRFRNYEEAWQSYIKGARDDILIFEWSNKTKGLTSEQFVQRFRAQISRTTPLVILVSTIHERDQQMISDMRIIEIIKKPIREKNFLMVLSFCIEQLRHPIEPRFLEWKIEQMLTYGDSPYIQYLKKIFINNKNVDPKRKYYIESYYQYRNSNYKKAKSLLMKGIKFKNLESQGKLKPNIDKKILLAKCFDHLEDKVSAIKLIEISRKASPRNIELLCYQSLLYWEIEKNDLSIEVLEYASSLDKGNPHVITLRTLYSIFSGDLKQTEDLFKHIPNIQDIIATINSQAVKKIKAKDYSLGIKIYDSLIKSIPDSYVDYKGIILYNKALALLKNNNVEDSIDSLSQAIDYKEAKTYKRAVFLLKKLKQSTASNSKISNLFSQNEEVNYNIHSSKNIEMIGLYTVLSSEPGPLQLFKNY